MYSLKRNFAWIIMLLILSEGCPDLIDSNQRHKKATPTISITDEKADPPPYWESMLKEFVFRTISSPPPGNNVLYNRLLNAPFYSGPFPTFSKQDDNVALSRGNVYYLPMNQWLLCQEGCIKCEVCDEQKNPTVKWILRRIKRLSSHGSPRYDLQLTIIPQIDGSYHMNNLWPRSYVYVTSPGEQETYFYNKSSPSGSSDDYFNFGDNFFSQQQRHGSFWKFVDMDSVPDRWTTSKENSSTSVPDSSGNLGRNIDTTRTTGREETTEYNQGLRNIKRQRPRLKFTEKAGSEDSSTAANSTENWREKTFLPKLILGTDQRGHKHLVHLVPAEPSSTVATNVNFAVVNSTGSMSSAGEQGLRSSKDNQSQKRSSYQRILRRIVDSLNNHRRSIENFLEPPVNLVNRKEDLIGRGSMQDQIEEHQQQETRSGFTGLKRTDLHRGNDEKTHNRSFLHKRLPAAFKWSRQRRKTKDNVTNDTNNINRNVNDTFHENTMAEIARETRMKENISNSHDFKPLHFDYKRFNDNKDTNKPTNNRQDISTFYPFLTTINTEPTVNASTEKFVKVANFGELLKLKEVSKVIEGQH